MGARPETTPLDFQLAIRALCRRVDFLTSRLSHLETLLEERPQVGCVVVTEESYPVESGVYPDRLCQTEEGPPELPQSLLDFAYPLIAGPGVQERATRVVLGVVVFGVVWPSAPTLDFLPWPRLPCLTLHGLCSELLVSPGLFGFNLVLR